MKSRKHIIVGTFLAIPIVLGGAVIAQEAPTPTLNTEDKTALQQRLEKRKNDLNIKQVTNMEKLRIQQKCKASQGVISALRGRITGIDTSRTNVYAALTDRLTKLVERLKNAGADTTKLETEIAELTTKIETFRTDLEAYKTAVGDLAAMDCAADPVAFKASLEASRAALTKVKADTADIKTYVNDTIKPTLKDIRTQLASTKSEEGSE